MIIYRDEWTGGDCRGAGARVYLTDGVSICVRCGGRVFGVEIDRHGRFTVTPHQFEGGTSDVARASIAAAQWAGLADEETRRRGAAERYYAAKEETRRAAEEAWGR